MKTNTPENNAKNALEWSVFALSCLLLITVTGVLLKEVFAWEDRPARLEVRLGQAVSEHQQINVPVEVINHGDQVAVDVALEVLRRTSNGEQRAVVSFDFVPRDSTRRGRISFRKTDELPGALTVEVIGHQEP